MTRKLLRVTLIGLVALVALGALLPGFLSMSVSNYSANGSQSPWGKPVNGECNLPGVTLVIERYPDSGSTKAHCVPGFKGTGWQLFAGAGIEVQGTTQYPAGFVCRIAGYPAEALESCTNTPNGRVGTWSYFYATAQDGGKWHLSMQGAAQRQPPCGSVEAWVFSRGATPPLKPQFEPHPISCVID